MLSSKIKGFFYHAATWYALRQGWDLEESLEEFYTRTKSNMDKPYVSVYSAALDKAVYLTEKDVFEASKGNVTESFKTFWKQVELGDGTSEDKVVLQSMHSGSSDYLFVSDVKELQKL